MFQREVLKIFLVTTGIFERTTWDLQGIDQSTLLHKVLLNLPSPIYRLDVPFPLDINHSISIPFK